MCSQVIWDDCDISTKNYPLFDNKYFKAQFGKPFTGLKEGNV